MAELKVLKLGTTLANAVATSVKVQVIRRQKSPDGMSEIKKAARAENCHTKVFMAPGSNLTRIPLGHRNQDYTHPIRP